MNWKNYFASIVGVSAIGIVLCLVAQWTGLMNHISLHDFVIGAFQVIAWSMGVAGSDELNRCGFDKIRINLFRGSLWSLALPIILLGVGFLFKVKFSSIHVWVVLLSCPFWLLLISSFPLALYLTHKQKNSSTEHTIADAN
jgi:hypothetical protein